MATEADGRDKFLLVAGPGEAFNARSASGAAWLGRGIAHEFHGLD